MAATLQDLSDQADNHPELLHGIAQIKERVDKLQQSMDRLTQLMLEIIKNKTNVQE